LSTGVFLADSSCNYISLDALASANTLANHSLSYCALVLALYSFNLCSSLTSSSVGGAYSSSSILSGTPFAISLPSFINFSWSAFSLRFARSFSLKSLA
jgi:hypothetical protein